MRYFCDTAWYSNSPPSNMQPSCLRGYLTCCTPARQFGLLQHDRSMSSILHDPQFVLELFVTQSSLLYVTVFVHIVITALLLASVGLFYNYFGTGVSLTILLPRLCFSFVPFHLAMHVFANCDSCFRYLVFSCVFSTDAIQMFLVPPVSTHSIQPPHSNTSNKQQISITSRIIRAVVTFFSFFLRGFNPNVTLNHRRAGCTIRSHSAPQRNTRHNPLAVSQKGRWYLFRRFFGSLCIPLFPSASPLSP